MGTNAVEVPSPQDFGQIFKFIGGYRISRAIYVVVELGIPDLLSAGPMHCHELAAKTDSDASTLYRVLRFLAGVGLVDEVGHQEFALTRLGSTLRTDVPGSASTAVRLWLSDFHWRTWGHLIHSVRTGKPAFNHVYGTGVFEYLRDNPDASAVFNAAMTGNTARSGMGVVERYDFSSARSIVDVGGGQGFLLATILRSNPSVRGVLFDLPEVVAGADQVIASVKDRCEVVGGSFFDAVPEGGNVYILRQIIHDWNDERAMTILRNCRAAMGAAGKVLLIERQIASDHREAMRVLHVDLEMLVNAGGMERTDDEYRSLFARAGFELTKIVPLQDGAGFSLFEGVPSR